MTISILEQFGGLPKCTLLRETMALVVERACSVSNGAELIGHCLREPQHV